MRGDLSLKLSFALWPMRFDPLQCVAQFLIRVSLAKTGHVAFVASSNHRGGSASSDVEQYPVSVMPGMSCCVMWRSGQTSVRSGKTPIELPFQRRTMANGTGLRIDLGSTREVMLLCCAVGPWHLPTDIDPRKHSRRHDDRRGSGPPPHHSLILRSLSEFPMTETDDRLIATAAIIGDSRTPKIG